MMGDNRAGSCDSRSWGTVPREDLIGKVIATYWPPSRISIEMVVRPARRASCSRPARC